jgi:hypothetical protein
LDQASSHWNAHNYWLWGSDEEAQKVGKAARPF